MKITKTLIRLCGCPCQKVRFLTFRLDSASVLALLWKHVGSDSYYIGRIKTRVCQGPSQQPHNVDPKPLILERRCFNVVYPLSLGILFVYCRLFYKDGLTLEYWSQWPNRWRNCILKIEKKKECSSQWTSVWGNFQVQLITTKISSILYSHCGGWSLWRFAWMYITEYSISEPQCQDTYLSTCAPGEDSDQTAHSRSLIRIFARRI